jgi:hypothetical protein
MFQLTIAAGVEEDTPRDAEPEPTRPIVVANPPSDSAFRALIDAALRAQDWRPQDLQTVLRTRYPASIVRPRALAGERFVVWYVYRDGHWIGSEDDAGR